MKKQVAIKVSHVQYSSIGQQEVTHLRALNAADALGKDLACTSAPRTSPNSYPQPVRSDGDVASWRRWVPPRRLTNLFRSSHLLRSPADVAHIIRTHNSFYFGKHFCIVFELMSTAPLRHCIDLAASNRQRGASAADRHASQENFRINAIRKVAAQLFAALTMLKRQNMIQADVKPDNILLEVQVATPAWFRHHFSFLCARCVCVRERLRALRVCVCGLIALSEAGITACSLSLLSALVDTPSAPVW